MLLKETKAKSSSKLKHWKGGKRQPAKENTTVGKRKEAYSRLQNLQLQKVLLLMLMKVWIGENQACQSQVHVTALRCLRVKHKKWELNKRINPILRGGGLVLTHYLIM
jgi:hypothetical protein